MGSTIQEYLASLRGKRVAVLGIGDRHIAVGAGSIQLAEPIRVDVLCAPGALSDAVQADTILTAVRHPKWLDEIESCELRYGDAAPGLTLRPGRSMIWEEAQTIAIQ